MCEVFSLGSLVQGRGVGMVLSSPALPGPRGSESPPATVFVLAGEG